MKSSPPHDVGEEVKPVVLKIERTFPVLAKGKAS